MHQVTWNVNQCACLSSRKSLCIERKNKSKLSDIWRSNKKTWVTSHLIEDWFDNLVSKVERFLKQKNLTFEVLLLLDNAPGHPIALSKKYPEVEVVPFSKHYLHFTTTRPRCDYGFQILLHTTKFCAHLGQMEKDPTSSVSQCLIYVGICNAIKIIKE